MNRPVPNRREWLGLAVGLVVGILLVGLSTLLVTAATKTNAIRESQRTSVRKIDASTKTLQILQDCLQPGGDCYRRNQANTKRVIVVIQGSTVQAVSAVTTCQQRHPHATYSELVKCTTERLHETAKRVAKQ